MAKTIDNFKRGDVIKSIWSGDKFKIAAIDKKNNKATLIKLSNDQVIKTNLNDAIYELDA